MNYEEMRRNGYFKKDGKMYVLLEQAYRIEKNGDQYFEAPAIIEGTEPDEDGWIPYYMVSWEITGDYEDDSRNADWDSPEDIEECGEYNVKEERFV